MISILNMVLAIIGTVLGVYGLITNNFAILPYMMFFLATSFLLNGISELHKQRKILAILCFLTSAFIYFVLIHSIIR